MDKLMIDRLETILARYNHIQEDLQNDEVISNLKKYTELSKESRQLEATYNAYEKYNKALQTIEDSKILLLEDDADLVEMAKLEIEQAENDIVELEEQLKYLLLPKDPNDDKNVICEIRAGAGGEEEGAEGGEDPEEPAVPLFSV